MSWAVWSKLIGSGIQAAGAAAQGAAEASGYRSMYRAKKREAKEIELASTWQQQRLLEEGRRLTSTQRALYGQAGVTLEGTPTDVILESRRQVVLDKMMTARTGRVQKAAALAEAKRYKKAAHAATAKGALGAVGSFFS
jgi:hypothetical protein